MVNLVWLIPVLPFLGALTMLCIGRRLGRQFAGVFCSATVLASFVLSVAAVAGIASSPNRAFEVVYAPWMPAFNAPWGILLDPLSGVLILIVTGIGFLIHVYSIGYMARENGVPRYFGYLNLFVALMLMLVLANNYLLLFVGWEGVGLSSYLLISFFHDRHFAASAGTKAFLVNRVGDAAFLLGILLLFFQLHTLRFTEVAARANSGDPAVLMAACLLLLLGATGKSAQFPLHVWLPDAMEGPTPVSALIHAATMVTAGVYLIARSAPLFRNQLEVSALVAAIGAATALGAALVAVVQNDIKRVLAYSTISQLGFMFLALGVGAYWVAVFHLFTHAFFKALLFLGAGSVIHALGGEQDLRNMGGLKQKLPFTFWIMVIASFAIAGIPFFAGFFSKDEILWETYHSANGSKILCAIGVLTSFLTALYIWRLITLAFFGPPRHRKHPHEAPLSMAIPMGVLALGSIAAGWFGLPELFRAFGNPFWSFENWLSSVFIQPGLPPARPSADIRGEWFLLGISVALAIFGMLLAEKGSGRIARADNPIVSLLQNRFYLDDLYHQVFTKGLAFGGGRLLARFDQGIVDGGVNGAGWFIRLAGHISNWWDTWVVDTFVEFTGLAIRFASYPARLIETGSLQAYALAFAIGALAFLGYYLAPR